MPPPLRSGLTARLGQAIIAGSSEDISPADMLDWIEPVLSGLDGLWLTCELSPAGRGTLTAKLRSGAMAPHLTLCRTIAPRRSRLVRPLLPSPGPAAVVLLNAHAAQVVTLLDGMAQWLGLFEADDPAIGPIMQMLGDCGNEQTPAGAQKLRSAAGA